MPTAQSSLVLQPLLSDTEYKILITPVYPEGDGPTAMRLGRTRKSVHFVSSLSFRFHSEGSTSKMMDHLEPAQRSALNRTLNAVRFGKFTCSGTFLSPK